MYSIFNTKIKKSSHLVEGEPPPKKIITEEDVLIKQLTENQLKTNITLAGQLCKKKEFTSSETFTNITGYVRGKTELKDFEAAVADVCEIDTLKTKGLSNKDIEIYKDYSSLGAEFWVKYGRINEDILYRRITEIKALLSNTNDSDYRGPVLSSSISQEEYVNSLKSSTKPLKVKKVEGESKKNYLPGPMDELPNLEKQFINNIKEYSSLDIRKIRKKARSMGNKIKSLEDNIVDTKDCKQNKSSPRRTQWDIKEKPSNDQTMVEIVDKNKIYTCKPQNWYTLKDDKIVKLDENGAIAKTKNAQEDTKKLKLDDIKNIPKFSNYDPGIPSKVLFLKNLRKNVTELCLKNLLKQFEGQCYSVKVMRGKMMGQAFIHFETVSQASEALEVLNGVVMDGKPIIVEYGKRNT